jgi:hypothetical protein
MNPLRKLFHKKEDRIDQLIARIWYTPNDYSAAEELARYGPKVIRPLILFYTSKTSYLYGDHEYARCHIIQAIGEAAREPLLELLSSSSPQVRAFSAQGLEFLAQLDGSRKSGIDLKYSDATSAPNTVRGLDSKYTNATSIQRIVRGIQFWVDEEMTGMFDRRGNLSKHIRDRPVARHVIDTEDTDPYRVTRLGDYRIRRSERLQFRDCFLVFCEEETGFMLFVIVYHIPEGAWYNSHAESYRTIEKYLDELLKYN